MKTIFRNFYTTLRCYKMASALNVIGLSAAFAAFIVLTIQVQHEMNFDKGYSKSEQLFRVERVWDSVTFSPILSRPGAEILIESTPQIEAGMISPTMNLIQRISLKDKSGNLVTFRESVTSLSDRFVETFQPEILEGDAKCLTEPNKIMIPKSLAHKLFGVESPIGKQFTFEDWSNAEGEKESREIGAVYRDFPESSSQKNCIKARIPDNENNGNWENSNYYAYVRLIPGATSQEVARLMTEAYHKAGKPDWADGSNMQIQLTPLSDVYYQTGAQFDVAPKGNRSVTDILALIAILIVVIASINFVNFSTSLTPLRIKSINTQKVLGSSVVTLRAALIFEAIGISLLAWLLALGWVKILVNLNYSEYMLATIDLQNNPVILFGSLAIALLTGLLAGIYPAVYSTSFPPALVLKGSFGMSPKGKQLRTALIAFQFIISITLIIAALFLQLQNDFMRNRDNGMNTNQIATVDLGSEMAKKDKRELIANTLKANAQIKDVAYSFAAQPIGGADEYMSWGRTVKGRVDDITFTCLVVSENFIDLMGINIIEGHTFTKEGNMRDHGTFIFNAAAKRQFDLTLEDKVTGLKNAACDIVGFVEDFNFRSLRSEIDAMAFYQIGLNEWNDWAISYIKIEGDPYEAVRVIKESFAKINPNYPIEVTFYDAVFNELYQKERKTTALITSFSILAVIISLVGVFGIVLFETQFRRKEIGIRKVYGSTVGEILWMLNRKFIIIVTLCSVVAAPLAFVGVREWLSGFAYRTPIVWWVFAVAMLIVMLITLLTVNIQSYRAATENPVKSIKSE